MNACDGEPESKRCSCGAEASFEICACTRRPGHHVSMCISCYMLLQSFNPGIHDSSFYFFMDYRIVLKFRGLTVTEAYTALHLIPELCMFMPQG